VSSTITSYDTSDTDALYAAQYTVATQKTPGYRLDQVAFDLMSAENNLYASWASTTYLSRVRIINLPAAYFPASQLDFIVEGWTETPSTDGWPVTLDLSVADNPAWGIYGGATDYSRWQASSATLNTTVTNSGTTVVIATASGPTFTTVSARYPMNIQIEQEILTLTSAPAGATSPQTFTGVSRGTVGTTPAGHASGAAINLYPAVCWGL
jgi:hypothetical protein